VNRPCALLRKWLPLALRLVLGGLFVWAGALKILEPDKFAVAVANYRLVPHALVNLVAITVPWVEVVGGTMLLLGWWVRANALIMLGLTIGFFFFISSALVRGLNIECGCFGTLSGHRIGLTNLLIDAGLLSLAAGLWWLTSASPGADSPPSVEPPAVASA
jgi:uncharacterized membrane protein YphA (DoxX/SURF4 family)